MYVICTFVCFLLLYFFVRRWFLFRRLKGIQGPKGWPLIGNFMELRNPETALKFCYELPLKYGKNILICAGIEIMIFTSDNKLLEKTLSSQNLITKSKEYSFMRNWLGSGLLTSTGMKWRNRRKILTPAFHYNILEDFLEIFNQRGDPLIQNLEKEVGKDTVDIRKLFSYYTLDVICESSMGTAIDVQNNPKHDYFQAINEMCNIIYLRISRPLYRYDMIYELTSLYKHETRLIKTITDFSMNIIRKRRDIIKNLNSNATEVDEFGKRKKTSFLDILIKSEIDGKPLSDEEIREEVDTFLFEGYDTTSIALSFLAYNLARAPHVQKKILQEMIDILGNKEKKPNIEDLNQLKYLEMAIKESIRLYPSVPLYGRKVEEDLEYEGNIIPKDTSLILNVWSLHRDDDLYPEPFKFDPERFAPDKRKYGPYEYIPFSAGSRNCIGQKFAVLEIKSAITKLLWHFELKPAADFEPRLIPAVTLQSLNGVCVKLEKRTARN